MGRATPRHGVTSPARPLDHLVQGSPTRRRQAARLAAVRPGLAGIGPHRVTAQDPPGACMAYSWRGFQRAQTFATSPRSSRSARIAARVRSSRSTRRLVGWDGHAGRCDSPTQHGPFGVHGRRGRKARPCRRRESGSSSTAIKQGEHPQPKMSVLTCMFGAPRGIRTPNRQIRRLVLYVHEVVPSAVCAAQVRGRIQLGRLGAVW